MAVTDSTNGAFVPYVPEGDAAIAEYQTVVSCMAREIWSILDRYAEAFNHHLAATAFQEVAADALAADLEAGLLPEAK